MKEFVRSPLGKALALSMALHVAALLTLKGELLRPKREIILEVTLISSPAPEPKSSKKATSRRRRPRPERHRAVVAKREKKPRIDPERRRLQAIKEIEKRVGSREVELSKGIVDLYLVQLRERVWSFWTIPDGLLREDLKAVIRAKIDKDGRLLMVKVEEGSGDPSFDRSALQALLKAEPLPPPPGGRPLEVGLVFRPY